MAKLSRARQVRAALAAETLSILEQGHYTAPDGQAVSIADDLGRAIYATTLVTPSTRLELPADRPHTPHTTLRNETTLQAGRRLVTEERLDLAVLNFASAKNPGGGFLGGSEAQEESLARSGGLYACIQDSALYHHHRSLGDPLYSHHMLYSPGVPFFRLDDGTLLGAPWTAAVITSPAVNAGVARKNGKSRQKIRDTMQERMKRVLLLAAQQGHDAVLLGAWGCGVFRNDPAEVARLFRETLDGELRGAFRRVHFAVYDTENGQFIEAFRRYFPLSA